MSIDPVPTLRVATYNVKNLFDAVDDPDHADETTPPKPVGEQLAAAASLRAVEADVVALQEVENREVLDEWVDTYLRGLYPYRVLIEGNDPRGIDVAVLSRYPVTGVESHRDREFSVPGEERKGRLQRDMLRVDLDVRGHPFSVYTVHLKSHGGGDRADRQRLGEARAMREILSEDMREYPRRDFVVMGDFNDTPESPAMQVFFAGEEAGFHLHDVLEGRPLQERYTHPSDRPDWTPRQIDYIMVPHHLRARVTGARVHRLPFSAMGSDHFIVSADVALGQRRPDPPSDPR